MGNNPHKHRDMATSTEININVRDFSTSPGPRYVKQGEASGELFYHQVLNPLFLQGFNEGKPVIVNLDGVDGYMSSFLDEAFGNLVFDFGADEVAQRLSFISLEEPEWAEMIQQDTYGEWEKRRKKKIAPKITYKHNNWSRLENGSLVEVNYEITE